ncbi:MAG: DUF418 domain-containing protein [Chitinophagaceae bacterium]|nr:MAG: DUF418 domain-containing protein [Chitinophagaceae bacterium]
MNHPLNPGQSSTIESQASSFIEPATPLIQSERVQIIDALRGIALLGILLMNIPYFSLPFVTANDLRVRNEYSGINYYTWWTVSGFFEGTMRALFSMLFGAGSILLISRLEKKHGGTYPADIYYRRLIWLLIFGLINAFIFLWPGDILYSYAICGLFLFPFRKMAPKYLFLMGIGLMLIMNLKNTLTLYEGKSNRQKGEYAVALDKKKQKLSPEQKKDKEQYEARIERLKPESMKKEAAKEVAEFRKGYFSLMAYMKKVNVEIQTNVFYNNYFYDVLAFFFFGMALFKLGVLTGERSLQFYMLMSLIGYAIGLTLSYLILRASVDVKFDRSYLADKLFFDFYDEKRLFLCLGHVGLIMTVYKLRFADWLFRILAPVGQMAFSNYLMQSIICTLIYNGYGLKWFDAMQRYQIYFVVAGIWIFQIIFSNIWLRYYRFGPFEWLWRSLTYWKKQGLVKQAVA